MNKLNTHAACLLAIALCSSSLSRPVLAKPDQLIRNVEVAFVLDTTGSMASLIDGAKQKIWSIANEIIDVQNGEQVKVRFALIGYRDRQDAYVTKVYDMTDDIHGIYGHLLAFQAQGGGDRPEAVNQALQEAVNEINWSEDQQTLRLIFLVGDAPPHMDYANEAQYPAIVGHAAQHNIIVNTVQAGIDRETSRIWREIAHLGQGDYVAIAQDGGMQVIHSPYDQDIEALQQRINRTALGYGTSYERKQLNAKRDIALNASSAVASDMAEFRLKAGKKNQVITGASELVEDYEDGTIDLETIAEADLPDALQALSAEERKAKVEALVAERKDLNQKLETLVSRREAHIELEREKLDASTKEDSFDSQVRKTIAKQMKRR